MATSPSSQTVPTARTKSFGESLLPILFAAMETCWVDAILLGLASIHFFGLNGPLLPLWAPFVLLAGTYWLVHAQKRANRAGRTSSAGTTLKKPGNSWLIAGMALIILLAIWDGVYSTTTPLFYPSWLLRLFSDLLTLNGQAFHTFGIVLLALYFCWRGLALIHRTIEPEGVYRIILLGLAAFVAASLLVTIAGRPTNYNLFLLILIPLFFTCALFTHAIAHAIFLRNAHPTGVQGGAGSQERSLFMAVGLVCLAFILVTLVLGLLASPTVLTEFLQALAPLGKAYDWFVNILANILVFLAGPVFWLFSVLPRQKPAPLPFNKQPAGSTGRPSGATPLFLVVLAVVLKVVLAILLLALVVFLIWLALHKYKPRKTGAKRGDDVRESLWSWLLFWAQLRAFFQALWQRLFSRHRPPEEEADLAALEGTLTPLARGIRELYRAFLKWSAARGYARKKYETPYEFKQRLDKHLPQAEPEVRGLTEAYAAIRYGNTTPDEAILVQAQQHWLKLQQKAERPK